jgi:hypothetical protein
MLSRAAGAGADAPHTIHRALPALNKSFVRGRQEDAHELLRCLVDAMERSLLRQNPTYNPQKPPRVSSLAGNSLQEVYVELLQHDSVTLVQQAAAAPESATERNHRLCVAFYHH